MDRLEFYRQKASQVISEIGSLNHEPLFFAELVAVLTFLYYHGEDTDVEWEAYTRMKSYVGYGADLAQTILDSKDDADLYVMYIVDQENDRQNL